MCEHGNAIGEIKHLIGDIKEDVGEIKVQAKITNGRIKSLEIWRSFIIGGLTIIGIVGVPIGIWAITSIFQIDDIDARVQSALQRELSQYEVIIE